MLTYTPHKCCALVGRVFLGAEDYRQRRVAIINLGEFRMYWPCVHDVIASSYGVFQRSA